MTNPITTKLSFSLGKFVLIDGKTKRSLDLPTAVAHADFADAAAKRVLDRIMVKKYFFNRPLPPWLDRHQKEGIRWILSRSACYLAHAPGAGKTAQAIVAAHFIEAKGQVLVVCPPNATVNWEREIQKWTARLGLGWPSITVVPESAQRSKIAWRGEWIICADTMLTRDWVLKNLIALDKKLLAVDEASRFKESTAQRSIGLFGGELNDGTKSPGLQRNVRHVVLLDGSPTPNGRPMEIWGPTYAIAPEVIDFRDQASFGFRYCGAKINERGHWEFKYSSHEKELQRKLRAKFMHVVPESELQHPDRLRTILPMTTEVRTAEHMAWERANIGKINFETIDEETSQGELAHYRMELGLKKVPWVASYVADRLHAKNEKLLVFAWHRDVVLGLAERLKEFNPGVVMGGTPDMLRESYFAEFQEGSRNLLIMNIASGGRIHNLQKAKRVIFAEFSWSDESNKQAEKRASRKGSSCEAVRCEYIVAPGSMDETILKAVFRKAETTRKVIGE